MLVSETHQRLKTSLAARRYNSLSCLISKSIRFTFPASPPPFLLFFCLSTSLPFCVSSIASSVSALLLSLLLSLSSLSPLTYFLFPHSRAISLNPCFFSLTFFTISFSVTPHKSIAHETTSFCNSCLHPSHLPPLAPPSLLSLSCTHFLVIPSLSSSPFFSPSPLPFLPLSLSRPTYAHVPKFPYVIFFLPLPESPAPACTHHHHLTPVFFTFSPCLCSLSLSCTQRFRVCVRVYQFTYFQDLFCLLPLPCLYYLFQFSLPDIPPLASWVVTMISFSLSFPFLRRWYSPLIQLKDRRKRNRVKAKNE